MKEMWVVLVFSNRVGVLESTAFDREPDADQHFQQAFYDYQDIGGGEKVDIIKLESVRRETT